MCIGRSGFCLASRPLPLLWASSPPSRGPPLFRVSTSQWWLNGVQEKLNRASIGTEYGLEHKTAQSGFHGDSEGAQ
eukprot:13928262-Alexandrium_andersonii.AAC.1